MKRIVFLDYVRVFACFLVMIVHASENFYGAAGSTDMAGPQSFLANEADRRILTHVCATVHDSVGVSARPDEGRADHVAVLPQAEPAHTATVLRVHDTLLHAAAALGTD